MKKKNSRVSVSFPNIYAFIEKYLEVSEKLHNFAPSKVHLIVSTFILHYKRN